MLLFLSLVASLQAQEISTKLPPGYVAYKQLTKADFKVDTDGNAGRKMRITPFCFHRHQYATRQEGERFAAKVIEWRILSGFIAARTSRIKTFRDGADGLPHEQGHLDLNEIYSRELANISLEDLPKGEGSTKEEAIEDLDQKLKALVDVALAKCYAEQDEYDTKTNHGENKAEQKKATERICARLGALPITGRKIARAPCGP